MPAKARKVRCQEHAPAACATSLDEESKPAIGSRGATSPTCALERPQSAADVQEASATQFDVSILVIY